MSARATLSKKSSDVAHMFDQVAARYDLTNDLTSLGQVRVWREAMAHAVDARPGLKVLDVAAGTGTSSAAYASRGAEVIASDFSAGMIAEGKRRHPELTFVEADALNLPFDDESFDVATISYGLRNVEDTKRALEEMMRVVKPGGKLVVAEFSTPTWKPFRELYRFYLGTVMPAVSALFSSDDEAYDYLTESILAWPAQEDLALLIQDAGWRKVEYRNLSGGIVAIHRATRP
ncbi:demethylmenaquinone methyltransferase [Arcanobacterium haemolyticum]|nr:demethylmenaquinone methyltransferase [Arcanobacterium haemolyticum]